MSTPANATTFPVYGQLYNFTGIIKSLLTGNALTGGLTGLTAGCAQISKNDGAFVNCNNLPVEIGTSGVFTLDLTAAEMSCQKAVISVSASNTNAVYSYTLVNPIELGQFTGRWDAQTVLRFEQLWLDLFAGMALNGANQTGAQLQLLNPDGSVHFTSTVTQNQTTGTRSKAT